MRAVNRFDYSIYSNTLSSTGIPVGFILGLEQRLCLFVVEELLQRVDGVEKARSLHARACLAHRDAECATDGWHAEYEALYRHEDNTSGDMN